MGALQREDYASAGLVNVNGERFFSNRSGDGRWCPDCRRLWNRWNAVCVKCGAATVTESEMDRTLPPGPYTP